ncbi:golgin subfamily A member 6-like protein 6 isoform X1 [Gallus gallus]|uniref:golgin subfamily A member 6-like protein 6 isoform X1 n=2 Tax=Gallus gallus TaxID=9031 RepID=UPI001AEAE1F6|nr:golgin subfamily A member 6-like protein 6 isoform X1 [Gallus gallus]XP_046794070.1 golgin subfamily A member 6-like protein 6 isoform X1 [Gallus gallus]
MPEMSKSVISRNDCVASQTTSGRVTVFPMYEHKCIIKMTETPKVDLKYHVKTRHEQGWARPGDSGTKGDLCETRLLHRAALSPIRLPALTVMPGRDQKAEEKEPRTRQLPAVPGRPLQDKEEQGKVIPLVTPRMVDFIAAAVEANRRIAAEKKCAKTRKGKEQKGKTVRKEKEEKGKTVRKEKEEKGKKVKEKEDKMRKEEKVKQEKVKEEKGKKVKEDKMRKEEKVKQEKKVKFVQQEKVKVVKQEMKVKNVKQEKVRKVKQEEKSRFSKHAQKFLAEEEKKNKMLKKQKKKQAKQQELEAEKTEAQPEEVEMPVAQESSTFEEEYSSSLSESETEQSSSSCSSSHSLIKRMMGEQEEAEEEPPRVSWDSAHFPKRRLTPVTEETLREVVKCIVEQVAREQQGQRDAEKDLQGRLQSELAVLRWSQWSRSARETPSILSLSGPQYRPAPPPGPRPGKAARVGGVGSCKHHVIASHSKPREDPLGPVGWRAAGRGTGDLCTDNPASQLCAQAKV